MATRWNKVVRNGYGPNHWYIVYNLVQVGEVNIFIYENEETGMFDCEIDQCDWDAIRMDKDLWFARRSFATLKEAKVWAIATFNKKLDIYKSRTMKLKYLE